MPRRRYGQCANAQVTELIALPLTGELTPRWQPETLRGSGGAGRSADLTRDREAWRCELTGSLTHERILLLYALQMRSQY